MSGYGAADSTKMSDYSGVQCPDTSDCEQICDTLLVESNNDKLGSQTSNAHDGVSHDKDGETHLKYEGKKKHLHDCQGEVGYSHTMLVPDEVHYDHHHIGADQLQGVRSFLLLVAMSCHKLFEGLAVGLQDSSSEVWSLFLAIIIHQCVISFSLGIQFAENLQHPRRAVLFIFIFAVMSPVGAAIGTGLTEGSAGHAGAMNIASAVLQAISAGVFLYVTFFEVLGREVGCDHNILKVILILVGYAVIAVIQLVNPEPEHGH